MSKKSLFSHIKARERLILDTIYTNIDTQKSSLDTAKGLYFNYERPVWYDYGARFYDPQIGIYHTHDLLAEKYYELTPYNYVGDNPIKRIDLFGLDWYTDKDGTYQYDPELTKDNSKDRLKDGQKYAWETHEVKDNNGIVTTSYRKDGSIMYSNETEAYNRMWNQAKDHYKGQKEVGGIITKNGVLVLPDYLNDINRTKYEEYGYAFEGEGKNAKLVKGNDKFGILGMMHTHQDPLGDAEPSIVDNSGGLGDLGVSRCIGRLPVMTIGHDGYIHGVWYSGYTETIDFGGLTRQGLLIGAKLIPFLKNYPTLISNEIKKSLRQKK